MINEDHAAATSARGARHETVGGRQDAPRVKGRVRREMTEGRQGARMALTVTGAGGLDASAIGKIAGFATRTYVAIERSQVQKAMDRLRTGKVKGRSFRIRKLG